MKKDGRCRVTGKVRIPKREALRILARVDEMRVYYCRHCRWWHRTSKKLEVKT